MSKPIYCEICGKELDPARAVSLELNCDTGEWGGDIPPESSQGWFYVGRDCAAKAIKGER